MRLKQTEEEKTINYIIEGIKEKKGKEIVSIDLTKLDNAVCSYFVICHGDSSTQINAIANWVEKVMEDKRNEKAWQKQGFENAQWILLDYVDIVIHIFQKESRDFYNLESLWADGYLSKFENEYIN
jgi:ribosome-associated protein